MERKEMRNALRNYMLLWMVIFVALWAAYEYNFTGEGLTRGNVLLLMAVVLAVAIIFMPEHNMESWIELLLLAGIAMRIWYTVYTPYNVRVHDLGDITIEGDGHAAYILQLFENGALPDNNQGQFYHPPLFYLLSAVVMKFFSLFHKGDSVVTMMQIVRVIPCYASCMTLIFMKKIMEELKLSKGVRMVALAVVSFLPGFYLLSATVNNDSLALCFMMWIVLCFIRWCKTGKVSALLGMALGFGFGMMTKVSVGVLAIPIGIDMFVYLLRRKKPAVLTVIRQYVLFLAVSLPLGMWYPIRNRMLFDQPFTYVLNLKDTMMPSLAGVSLWKRIFPWNFGDWLHPVFANVQEDYNIPEYLLKSSLFGEFSFDGMGGFAYVLFILNLLLVLLSLAALVYLAVISIRRRNYVSIGIVSLWCLWMASYIGFNIRYPYGCSMDFRYVPMTAFAGAVALAVMAEEMWRRGGFQKTLAAGIYGLTGCFAAASVICYSILS